MTSETPETPIERIRCKKCSRDEWRDGFCYTHYRLSQGFVFDEEIKRFVLPKKRSKKK